MIRTASRSILSRSALAAAGLVTAFTASPAAAQTARDLKCNGCVHSRDIRNNVIKSKDIKNGQVKNADLAGGAVSSDKIAGGAVSSDKIAGGAVSSDKIADGAVGLSKLGPDVVTSAASPISGCTTITQPGSYVLTQNIIDAPGDCIMIGADFVTLDLAGFRVDGVFNDVGITDQDISRQGISIYNGTVTQFDAGINLSHTVGGQLHKLRVMDNGGRGIDAGSGFLISDNVVIGNGAQGIFVGFTNASTTVSGNIANDNSSGIVLAGEGMTVIGNTANGSSGVGGAGISVNCPANVLNNTALNNAGTNLSLTDPANCNESNNLAP